MAIKNAIEIIISATDKASDVLSKASNTLSGIGEKMTNFAQRNEVALFRLGNIGKETLQTLGTHITNFTDKAGKTKEAEEAMGRLAKNMNLNSKDILSGLQKASKGTVTNYDLILSANKAMSLGVAKNTNDFTTLMEIARVKAKNMGITTTQAYNDIVTGLGRGSAMILDNLGITINATQANEEYAKSIGKTAKELTDAEKKQALINKVVADGKKELEAMGEIALTDPEKRQKAKAQIENMQDRLGKALLPTVQKLLEAVTPLIERFTQRVEENPKLSAGIIQVVAILSTLAVVVSSIGLATGPLGIGLKTLSVIFSSLSGLIPMITGGLSSLGPILTALTGPIGWVVAALAAVGVAYATNLFGFRDAVHSVVGKIVPILQDLGGFFSKIFGEIWTTIKTTRDQIAPILLPIWEDLKNAIVAILQGVIIPAIKAFAQMFAESFKATIKTLGEIISFVRNVFTGNWSGAWQNLQNIINIWKSATINIFSSFSSLAGSIFGGISTRLSGIWNALREGMKNTVSRVVNRISSQISAILGTVERAKNAVANVVNGTMNGAKNIGRNALSAVGLRASGGNVLAGQLYRVNELGTEYFQPAVNGRIERSSQTSRSFTINFGSVVINNGMDLQTFEDRIRNVIYQEQRKANLGYF